MQTGCLWVSWSKYGHLPFVSSGDQSLLMGDFLSRAESWTLPFLLYPGFNLSSAGLPIEFIWKSASWQWFHPRLRERKWRVWSGDRAEDDRWVAGQRAGQNFFIKVSLQMIKHWSRKGQYHYLIVPGTLMNVNILALICILTCVGFRIRLILFTFLSSCDLQSL